MTTLEIPKIKNILILRGGKIDHDKSFLNGKELILSLTKYGEDLKVVDVFIDKEGNWFERGIPSDIHKAFSKADFYIDTTHYHNKNTEYHQIAKKLFVRQIFDFKNNLINQLDRLNLKKILRQINIQGPRHYVFRDLKTFGKELKELWKIFHTPVVIKEIKHHDFHQKSILTYSYLEAFKKIKEILEKDKEVLIEEYEDGRHFSVGVFPNFRKQNIYIPTPVENFFKENKKYFAGEKIVEEKYLKDNIHDKRLLHPSENILKEKILDLAKKIFESIHFEKYILIDILVKENKQIKNDFKFLTLEIHTNPQIFEDSKMDFIIKNNDINLGEIILSEIENKFLIN